jgi:zinc transport system ATP-binding protein
MSQIICRDLSLSYNGKTVSEGVSFTVEAGDYLCIVGDNGSGKTTLMKAILGLKLPDKGEILFDKESRVRAGDIGYLPQQTESSKDLPASVYETVLSGFSGKMGLRPFHTKAEREEARKNMERMGVLHLEKKSFSELSGGQRQRILLARALCAASKILLLDEPVSGLDPNAAADMYSVIQDLNKNLGITVIMITHDIEAVVRYSSKVLRMGTVPTFFGSAEEYEHNSFHSENDEEDKNV